MQIDKKPKTATEIDEGIMELTEKFHKALEPFLHPVIMRCVEILALNGYISDEDIERITNDEISRKYSSQNEKRENSDGNPT